MIILDLIARVVSLTLTLTSYAMALRMILPLFVEPENSKIYVFTCLLSEPVVAPVRAIMSVFGFDEGMPIDLSLPTAYFLIFIIQLFLPSLS